MIHPTTDHSILIDEFMTFQIGYIIFDALFKIKERMEVEGVDGGRVGVGEAFLEHGMEFGVITIEHTALGMVNNGDFDRVEDLLRNDERGDGSFAIWRG